jgi:hypothetical protein
MMNKGNVMFNKITDIRQALLAMEQGIVCMVCPTDTDETRNLIVTRHREIIGQLSQVNNAFDGLEPYLEVDDISTSHYAYDLLNDKVVEMKLHLFNGHTYQMASIEPFDGPVRTLDYSFERDQSVEVAINEGETQVGTIVFINEKSQAQRFVVLIEADGLSKTLMFDEAGICEDGKHTLKPAEKTEGVEFWRYIGGGEYLPAIDLRKDGYNVPQPLVFVVGYDKDVLTIAVDTEGKDSKGEKLFEKVMVNMLPVECEYYLLVSETDISCISKQVMRQIDGPFPLVLPVLAYIDGLEITHITLLSRT